MALPPSVTNSIARSVARPRSIRLPMSERVLAALLIDAQGDHDQVASDVHPVEEDREQGKPGQVPAEQLGELCLGGPAKAPGDRRARGAVQLDLADRL